MISSSGLAAPFARSSADSHTLTPALRASAYCSLQASTRRRCSGLGVWPAFRTSSSSPCASRSSRYAAWPALPIQSVRPPEESLVRQRARPEITSSRVVLNPCSVLSNPEPANRSQQDAGLLQSFREDGCAKDYRQRMFPPSCGFIIRAAACTVFPRRAKREPENLEGIVAARRPE